MQDLNSSTNTEWMKQRLHQEEISGYISILKLVIFRTDINTVNTNRILPKFGSYFESKGKRTNCSLVSL